MDKYDTKAEELLDRFTARDELSAAIGEALRKAAKKAKKKERAACAEVAKDGWLHFTQEQDIRDRIVAAIKARSGRPIGADSRGDTT